MPNFYYGNTSIEYELIYRADITDAIITVEWLDGVTVTIPEGTNDTLLHSLLYKKAPWILSKWNELVSIETIPTPKEYVSGEKFPYIGRNYRLKVHKENVIKPTLSFQHGQFVANIPTSYDDTTRKKGLSLLFKSWYFKYGQLKVAERCKLYCTKMGLHPKKIELKEQKMRWGSCTKEGVIYLNWKIMMAPMSVIDYVIVHELAHLKHYNHSSDFWQLVRSTLPDYEHRKEWLRVNGPHLTID